MKKQLLKEIKILLKFEKSKPIIYYISTTLVYGYSSDLLVKHP